MVVANGAHLGIALDGKGDVVDVHDNQADVAHGVIEEFMLAANREVARLMLQRQVPTLFRHHPPPDDLSSVWQTLKALGVARSSKGELAPAIRRAVERGFGPTISSAMLRCLPRAIYTTRASSHSSLGFEAYAHFTSPIRRYPDLLVHRWDLGQGIGDEQRFTEDELAQVEAMAKAIQPMQEQLQAAGIFGPPVTVDAGADAQARALAAMGRRA